MGVMGSFPRLKIENESLEASKAQPWFWPWPHPVLPHCRLPTHHGGSLPRALAITACSEPL